MAKPVRDSGNVAADGRAPERAGGAGDPEQVTNSRAVLLQRRAQVARARADDAANNAARLTPLVGEVATLSVQYLDALVRHQAALAEELHATAEYEAFVGGIDRELDQLGNAEARSLEQAALTAKSDADGLILAQGESDRAGRKNYNVIRDELDAIAMRAAALFLDERSPSQIRCEVHRLRADLARLQGGLAKAQHALKSSVIH
ncbi:MAG: hypothetical protein GC151_13265 [Betaproteobacteria bacterium]|nr:hypothetical protein [Betaproteobacteria bacterium]